MQFGVYFTTPFYILAPLSFLLIITPNHYYPNHLTCLHQHEPTNHKIPHPYIMRIYQLHFIKHPENVRFSKTPSNLKNFFQKSPFLRVKFSKNTHIWTLFFLNSIFMPLSHRRKHKIKFAWFHFFMRAGARIRNNEKITKIDIKRSFFNLFEKFFRHKLWFPYINPPRTC